MRTLIVVILICNLSFIGHSQVGGVNGFEFVNLAQSARSTSLSGGVIAIKDSDVSLAYSNPALLNANMHGQLSINQNLHYADIGHGLFSYGFGIKGLHMHATASYITYGDFARSDLIGNQLGSFKANEAAFTVGAAKSISERFQVGVNARFINSRLDEYQSAAVGIDIGGVYENPETNLVLALSMQHLGASLSHYTDKSVPLPLNIQIGISKRLQHLPFRLSVTMHHLNQWDLGDQDEIVADILFIGEEPQTRSRLSRETDNFFRHFIFNGEFLLGKNENLRFRFGYNHQRKKELQVSSLRSLGGFSTGIGFQIKGFTFDYGLGYYHFAGAVNHISIRTNLSRFRKKI